MAWLYFLVLGPVLAGIVLALAWWLVWGRKKGLASGSVGWVAVAAGLLLVFGGVAERLAGTSMLLPFDLPMDFWGFYRDYRFTFPLLLGILGMLLLAFPVRARGGRGTADLTPRTPASFARRWWFVTPAVILALILVVTITAGAASQPDPTTGNYTMYFVDLGGERGMGTSIYGWFNSVPCLILIGFMMVIALLDLFLIARPALDHNHEQDVRVRTVRTRNVLAVGTGALLLHLGLIFGSLAGTASLRGTFAVSMGSVSSWTTFAALEPVFVGAARIAAVLGFALWASVALSAIPPRRRLPVSVRS